MSAETAIEFFRMNNGQVWGGIVRVGDTVMGSYGKVHIFFKGDYDQAREFMDRQRSMNQMGEEYIYTEFGGSLPSREAMERKRVSFVRSRVFFRLKKGDCGHLIDGCRPATARDLLGNEWEVVELSDDTERTVADNLSFVHAFNLAGMYAMQQPGECKVDLRWYFHHESKKDSYGWKKMDLPEDAGCISIPGYWYGFDD